jgi:hypothetical protein
MKIKCPLCGYENEEGNKFCIKCNEPLMKQNYSKDNRFIKKTVNKERISKMNKSRKWALYFLLIFGSIFLIGLITSMNDISVEEKSGNTLQAQENTMNYTQNLEECSEMKVLNYEGEIIETYNYFPIKEKKSYIRVEKNGDNNISGQKWWVQWEGKTIFDNREAFKISTLTYYGDVIESEYFNTQRKWYDFYEIDDEKNIIKVGEISRKGEIKIEDPQKTELFAEMEIGKKYITSEDHYLKCLGFSDANLPNGQIYDDCLVVDNVLEIRMPSRGLMGVFHKIQYFKKYIGCVMLECRQDDIKDGVFKKGKIHTTYLFKTGDPIITKEVYEYPPIKYLKLDEVLNFFSEDRWENKIKNEGQINKEHYKIISKEIPNFTINIWTNGNNIESIIGTMPLITGDKILDQLSLDYFQATLYNFCDRNIEVIKWILSDKTRKKAIYNNGEKVKSIDKIFNNIKINIRYISFSDGMLAQYYIKHKDDAMKKTFYVDPQKIQENQQ